MPGRTPQATDAPDAIASLVRAAQCGDESSWRRIVDVYFPRLVALGRSNGFGPSDSEEMAQDVFVTAAEQIASGRYSEEGRFESWLFRVAMNRLRDAARRRRRRPESALDSVPDPAAADGVSPGLDPETSGRLSEALAALGKADQEVIRLRHHAGLAFKAIADLLEQPVGTVLARHHRALKKLREALEDGVDERDADASLRSET